MSAPAAKIDDMKRTLTALSLLLLFCLAPETGAQADNCAGARVNFLSYDQALAAGRAENLPILLFFRRDGCRYCEMLYKTGFEREDIACYINHRFVAAIIDTGRQPDLKAKYRVPGEPTVWFLTPEGKGIDSMIGYVPPDRFALILHFIGDGAYQRMSFEQYEGRNGKGN